MQFDDDNEYTSWSSSDNMIPSEQQNVLNNTQYSQRDVDNQIACQFSSEDKLFAEVALNIYGPWNLLRRYSGKLWHTSLFTSLCCGRVS